MLAGRDPYELIGPGRLFDFEFPFRYPLPAAVVALPFSPFPPDIASGLFVGVGLGCLAWALMRHGHAPLIGLMSGGVASAINSVQWSPLFAAATVMTPLGLALVAKPTIGVAMFAARPSALGGRRRGPIARYFVRDTAELVRPVAERRSEWSYRARTASGRSTCAALPTQMAEAQRRGWSPPSRCVPMTPVLYETVPLALIPRRGWEAVLLVLASHVVLVWVMRVPRTDPAHLAAHLENSARAIALVLYPLATLMVLRRPNVGPVPAWLERRIAAWPAWLRGAQKTNDG